VRECWHSIARSVPASRQTPEVAREPGVSGYGEREVATRKIDRVEVPVVDRVGEESEGPNHTSLQEALAAVVRARKLEQRPRVAGT